MLRLSGGGLGLLGAALYFLRSCAGLLGRIQQLLELGLQLIHLPPLLLHLLLLCSEGVAKLLHVFGADARLSGRFL